MPAWTSPLHGVYAASFIDEIYVKVRDGQVGDQPSYAAIGWTYKAVAASWARGLGRGGPFAAGRRSAGWPFPGHR